MKCCEYQGYYLDWDDDAQEEQDVIKCILFTDKGIWDEYCYCDEEEAKECKLKRFVPLIEGKDKEIERLNKENEDLKLKLRQVYYYNEKLRSNRLSYILNDGNIDFGIEGRR